MTATDVLIALVVAFVLFELVEHVIIPLAACLIGGKRRSVSGPEGMAGKVALVKVWNGAVGHVVVDGELWRAVSDLPLTAGDEVVIREVRGLTLHVEPRRAHAPMAAEPRPERHVAKR